MTLGPRMPRLLSLISPFRSTAVLRDIAAVLPPWSPLVGPD